MQMMTPRLPAGKLAAAGRSLIAQRKRAAFEPFYGRPKRAGRAGEKTYRKENSSFIFSAP